MAKTLGFIGLGNMGSRLAANLAKDNGSIAVWNRDTAKLASKAPPNADLAKTIPDLVATSDIIFISISDDSAARDVMGQITSQGLDGKLVVDFSTIDPDTAKSLAELVAAKGGQMLDAAVSGSTPQVEARALTIFVGGPKEAFDAVRQLIEPLGRATHYMGENGSGLKMKLCVNAMLGIGIAALAEALTLAQKLGLDKATAIDALSGTAVMSASQTSKLDLAKRDDYSHVTFSLELMHKDLGLVLEQAQAHSVTLPVTRAAERLTVIGVEQGLNADFAVMIRLREQLAGLGQPPQDQVDAPDDDQ
jgi:3-hydroxyisobutyrate dehydrogenase-like beta-hydroxyacid dehydrogenase